MLASMCGGWLGKAPDGRRWLSAKASVRL